MRHMCTVLTFMFMCRYLYVPICADIYVAIHVQPASDDGCLYNYYNYSHSAAAQYSHVSALMTALAIGIGTV